MCPFVANQLFWAARMHAASVAQPSQPPRHLALQELTTVIKEAATDQALADCLQSLGCRVVAEDGVAAAVTRTRSAAPPGRRRDR